MRRAALLTRETLGELGLDTVPVATGSKGYHVVAALVPTVSTETMAHTMRKVGALLAARYRRVHDRGRGPPARTSGFARGARGT